MSRPSALMGVSARLRCIAFDVSRHFLENFKSERLKGQLVAPSKRDAIALKRLLDEFGDVTAQVVISAPDQREGETDVEEETDDEVVKFWRRMMEAAPTGKSDSLSTHPDAERRAKRLEELIKDMQDTGAQ